MIHRRISFIFCASLLLQQAAIASSPFFDKGVAAYNAGNYSEAIGNFGAAQASDFDQPMLHYYMANAYAHLHDDTAAIREYRIAFALKPEGELGNLCASALEHYKASVCSTKIPKTTISKEQADLSKLDSIHKQALTILKREAEDAKRSNRTQAQIRADELEKLSNMQAQDIQRRIQELIDSGHNNRHHELSDEAVDRINSLKKEYDLLKSNSQRQSTTKVTGVEESANNLAGLLLQKPKANSPKLVPGGTNLYVRNYEHPGSSKTSADKAPAAPKP